MTTYSRSFAPETEISDVAAIESVLGGDRAMFEIIVRRYNQRLYRVGMAYLRNHVQTEDAMQNTYLNAFIKLHTFKRNAAFSTWLIRIMINECLMVIRAQKRFREETLASEDHLSPTENCSMPSHEAADQEQIKALLEETIGGLSQAHRAVYILREVQHLSTTDTAACLNISEANVKVSLHRAREELKRQLLATAAGVELFDYPARYCNAITARVMEQIKALGPAPR
ncbi:MAG: sigma-70 family RNA polymerase sigma factor [Nibricoccus sp.]